MNFFEQELRRLFEGLSLLGNPRFMGNTCIAALSACNLAKIRFTSLQNNGCYDALRVDIINKTTGPVDNIVIDIALVLGKKETDHPYFTDGIYPSITVAGTLTRTARPTASWNIYQPVAEDYNALCDAVMQYVGAFA